MSIYPEKIAEALRSPARRGTCSIENGSGRAVNFGCGCFADLSLSISDKTIDYLRFRTNGCGYMIAAAAALADNFNETELASLKGAKEKEIAAHIEELLGKFPADRRNCLLTVIEAFRAALADHRNLVIEEFSGEKALVCTCFGITEERVIEVISTENVTEVSQVSDLCNAGSGCGSCRLLIQEHIDIRQSGSL